MNVFITLTVICIILIMLKSLIDFIRGDKFQMNVKLKESRFSSEIFYTLLIIYSTIITGFALIYFTLSFHGLILVEHGEFQHANVLGELIHAFYFSGVTLLTIGYGDVIPIGVGRLVALIEALIGYVLPTAFVLRLVQTQRHKEE